MKIPVSGNNRQHGFVLLLVVIMAGISILILAGAMYRTITVTNLNQRDNEYNACVAAAEAAVEKVYARMAYDFANYQVAGVTNNMIAGIYQTNIPLAAENDHWSNFTFTDAQGNSNRTYVSYAYNYNGPLPSAYSGLFAANSPVYRIVSNAKLTKSAFGVVGTAQEDVLLALVPLTTWAIFYNGLLEFTKCAEMTVNGRVHANGPVYVGTTASLVFNSGVSSTMTLTAPLVDGITSGWTPSSPSTWHTTFNGDPTYTTNVASITVTLAMTNSHFLIDIPTNGESPTSLLGAQRLYNQAQMVLQVTNSSVGGTNPTVTLTLQTSYNGQVPGADPTPVTLTYTNASPTALATNLPFLTLTNKTYDRRESATNLFTQIDVGRLATWSSTNTTFQNKISSANGQYATILYVADRRTKTTTQLPSVRLVNGAQLPANNGRGFTVATPNPLYVKDNYNVQTSSSSAKAAAGTTNTSSTVPAALMSDALTVLSPNWSDTNGYIAYSSSDSRFNATDMTINAAIITGTVPSSGTSGTTFSGGVHNLPRLLENWNNDDLWLNTSILRLWNSNMATNQFRNPAGFSPTPVNPYYNPPTRHFSFDLNFLDPAKVPPGVPVALVPIRFSWTVPPPNTTTYTPMHN